jgi:hypothetical protein
MDKTKPGSRRLLVTLFWVMFGLGIAVQAFAPRLKVDNNMFVIPPTLLSSGKPVDPAAIVAHERRMQLLSVGLTIGGALGLAFYYRNLLIRCIRPDRTKKLPGGNNVLG